MSWTKDYLRAKIFLSRKKFDFTMEMLFIVTLFTAIAKSRFSGLKRSSATILFHTYRKFDVNLPKTPSFRKKNASFIENNLPFVDIMFLSRKEAKGSTFRCLAIPQEIEELSGIHSSSVLKILRERLGLHKICTRWVPHLLTDEQKQSRIDLHRKL